MSFALSAGVSGLQAHQKMLDVAGNNLANINTVGFKASRIVFSELLSEVIKKASQPTATVGGTNPQQMGSGVQIASISPNMAQGNIVNTGNALDVAIEGDGYFVLSDGQQNLYTRSGAFAVDANSNLVDPATGYIVQRIGSVGEVDGFQTAGDSNVKVPYDVAIAASATTQIVVAGNLSADHINPNGAQTNALRSDIAFTTNSGSNATTTTKLSDLDQYTGTFTTGTITYSGYEAGSAGTAFSDSTTLPKVALTQSITSTTTMADILNKLNGTTGGTATSEVQTLTPDTNPTGGHYHLTYGGQTTGEIAHDADNATVKAALEALSTVGTDEITVGGAASLAAGALTFMFDNTAGDVGMLGFDFSGLTGGTTQAGSTMVETTKGVAVAGSGILGSGARASLTNGRIYITDTASGYSKSDLKMAWTDGGSGSMTMPAYFEVVTVGGEEVKNANIIIYDSQGGSHVLSAAFVRNETINSWDMVMTSISGNINNIDFGDRRIEDIEFNGGDGSYAGLNSTTGDTAQFKVTFAHDTSNPQVITVDLGTSGQYNGLTQFATTSTAVAKDQDGYESGALTNVSISNEGVLIGSFSNGIKKNLATIQIGLFQNAAGLESEGNGYFAPSVNSGDAIATQALTGGAGKLHGGSLEKSNADVASIFVSMIEAQNGYHANARTIKIANEMLRELTSLIR